MATSFEQRIVFLKDVQGRALGGAKLTFLRAGTSIKSPIYYDSDLNLVAPNPIQAGASGVFHQFFTNPLIEYDIIYSDIDDNEIKTVFSVGPIQSVADQVAQNTADIGRLSAQSDENTVDISQLSQQETTNFNDITTLQGEMNTAEADVLTLQSEVSTLQSDVVQLDLDVTEINESNHYTSFSLNGNTVNATRSPDVTVTNVSRSFVGGAEQIVLTFSANIIFYYVSALPENSGSPSAVSGMVQYDFTLLGTTSNTLTLYQWDEIGNPRQIDFSTQIFYKVA